VFLTGSQPLSSGQIGGAIRIDRRARNGNENCLARLPADDTDLDLVVAGESFFEGALYFSAGYCGSYLTLDLTNSRQ